VRLALALVPALLTTLSAEARAEVEAPHAYRLEVEGPVPFEESELRDAVALRIAITTDEDAREVRVRGLRSDAVSIDLDGKHRELDLGEDSGSRAARRVALAIADLAIREAQLPPALPPPRAPVVTAEAGPPPPREEPRGSRLRLAALAALIGSGGSAIAPSAVVEGSLSLSQTLRIQVDLAYARGPRSSVDTIALSLDSFPLRGGIAWLPLSVPLELRLLGVLTPYTVSASPTSSSGVNAGIEVALAYFLPVAETIDLGAIIAFDGNLTREDFRVHGIEAFATDRFAAWAGLGAAFEVGR
jgi:hypothetical protein